MRAREKYVRDVNCAVMDCGCGGEMNFCTYNRLTIAAPAHLSKMLKRREASHHRGYPSTGGFFAVLGVR